MASTLLAQPSLPTLEHVNESLSALPTICESTASTPRQPALLQGLNMNHLLLSATWTHQCQCGKRTGRAAPAEWTIDCRAHETQRLHGVLSTDFALRLDQEWA